MLSPERDCIKLDPLTIVFATSNAKIFTLFPLKAELDTNPVWVFKFVMLLPRVSRTSRPTLLALPRNVLT
ncbi:hypothetical protein HanRHA438_Chr14g0634091 [Helianthus annuus]|nr:hypothetical protein HanRHA438_Chr14g0634091 [Helianthus annuus]